MWEFLFVCCFDAVWMMGVSGCLAGKAGVWLPLVVEDEMLAAVEASAEVFGKGDAGVVAGEGFVFVDLDVGGEVEVGGGVEGWDGEGRLLWWSRCGLADFHREEREVGRWVRGLRRSGSLRVGEVRRGWRCAEGGRVREVGVAG